MKPIAISTARKAGIYLLQHFQKHPSLLQARATAKELTTKYDKGSDKIIVRELSKSFPDHNLLTEESGFLNRNSDTTWIVDSLDGSTNFARGNPFFAVSIAVMKKDKSKRHDELVLGVIYAPFLRELYVAEKGKGAFLNGKKIKVSSTKKLSDFYFVSCEGGDKTNRRIARINALFHPHVKDVRKLGSAALELAYVACGRADAYVTTAMEAWDVAAGVLLVEEAGGRVTNFSGKRWTAERHDVVASNGKLHPQILARL